VNNESSSAANRLQGLLLQKEQGYVAINPAFDKLLTSLRTAVAEENILDKEATSYADIFDAFRLALKHYQFVNKETAEDIPIAGKRENNQLSQRSRRNFPINPHYIANIYR
jgi:hypothetical protein